MRSPSIIYVDESDVTGSIPVATGGANLTSYRAGHDGDPRQGAACLELLLELRFEIVHPALIAHIVAHPARSEFTESLIVIRGVNLRIRIAGVHEKLDAVIDKLRQEQSTVVHAVALEHECLVHL
jgi:hypothetical protein